MKVIAKTMKYRIQHETYFFLIVATFTILFFFVSLILLNFDIHSPLIKIDATICVACIFLFILEQIFGTHITVNEGNVTIFRFYSWKTITYDSIASISIENFDRYRRKPLPHYDYRTRMNITLLTGKTIKLTDSANSQLNFFILTNERKPDEDVSIYNAYLQIKPRIRKLTSTSFE